jgi:hypothetical protein
MECKIDQKLPYVDLATMIRRQRQVKYRLKAAPNMNMIQRVHNLQ